MTAESPGQASDYRRIALLAVLLAMGTFLLYLPALKNGFVSLDDPDYVTSNSQVQQGLTFENVKWAFGTDNPASNWHPLTWMSHMLDVNMYGGRPFGHHLTNVVLQSVDVALLFVLLALATGELMRSAAVAALFAVHPLNVEAVAWVAERKSVLCLLFFLAACGAYGWYARKPSAARYTAVVLFFALALMSKVMVVTLPAALLLLDVWPFGRLEKLAKEKSAPEPTSLLRLILEKVPLLAMSLAAAGMTLYVHAKEHALAGGMPLSWRVKNGIFSYLAYLGKFAWPTRLAAFYPHPEDSLRWSIVAAAGIALILITALVLRFRSRRYLVVAWLWYLATMFPMVGFVQSGRQGMADRYMYLPMLGLLAGVVWLLCDWADEKNWNTKVPVLLFLLAVASCAYGTERQIGFWQDSYTLFARTLAVTSRNGMAENSFGSALYEKGDAAEATKHFEAAVQYSPDLPEAHYNLAMMRQRADLPAEAEQEYRAALRLSSDPIAQARAHNNLGVLYAKHGQSAAAVTEFSEAIRINGAEYNSYIGRGQIELKQFDYDKAIRDFAQAAQIGQTPQAFFLLGNALEMRGEKQKAADAYRVVLQFAPGLAEAKARLEALQNSGAAK